jgi:hypothetical protein
MGAARLLVVISETWVHLVDAFLLLLMDSIFLWLWFFSQYIQSRKFSFYAWIFDGYPAKPEVWEQFCLHDWFHFQNQLGFNEWFAYSILTLIGWIMNMWNKLFSLFQYWNTGCAMNLQNMLFSVFYHWMVVIVKIIEAIQYNRKGSYTIVTSQYLKFNTLSVSIILYGILFKIICSIFRYKYTSRV